MLIEITNYSGAFYYRIPIQCNNLATRYATVLLRERTDWRGKRSKKIGLKMLEDNVPCGIY